MLTRVRALSERAKGQWEKTIKQDKQRVAVGLIGVLIVFPPLASAVGAESDWFANWGAWLQGALTPLSLVYAVQTFQQQKKAQAEASMIANCAIFIEHVDKLNQLIQQRCESAFKEKMRFVDVNEYVNFAIRFLKYDAQDFSASYSIDDIRSTQQYHILYNDINTVVGLGESVRFCGVLDQNVLELHRLINEHPPISSMKQCSQ